MTNVFIATRQSLATVILGLILAGLTDVALAQDDSEWWESHDDCLRSLSDLPEEHEGRLVVVTWNVRWFPRGCANTRGCPNPPNSEWLACAIANMRADVVALQELVATADDRASMSSFLDELESLTNSEWGFATQACGAPNSLRVGYIWRIDSVRLSGFEDVSELNGAATGGDDPCAGSLRPGLYARLDVPQGNMSLDLLNVHLDSGTREKDYATRTIAVSRLPGVVAKRNSSDSSGWLIVGDFNTMGRSGRQRIQPQQELALLLDAVGPEIRMAETTEGCSYYYRGRPLLIDHAFATEHLMQEIASVRALGECSASSCGEVPEPTASLRGLSDHCPVLVEIQL